MKNMFKYIGFLFVSSLLLASCEKDEVGGTTTETMAGEWYVKVTCVDDDGGVVYEDDDFFGLGDWMLDTYNTNSNSSTEMWINDNENFWDFKLKVDIDLDAKTFSATDVDNEAYEDCVVNITDGKILEDAATTPSGSAADSIVFYVNFSDDSYPSSYGFSKYQVSGYRYTGLNDDDDDPAY